MNTFKQLAALFQQVGDIIGVIIYNASKDIFDSAWFVAAFTLAILIYGINTINNGINRERVIRAISFLIMYALIWMFLHNKTVYNLLVNFMDIPNTILSQGINAVITGSIGKIILPQDVVIEVSGSFADTAKNILDADGWVLPKVMYVIFCMTSMVLIIAIAGLSIISIFIAQVVFSLFPLIVPFALWKQTRGLVFSWAKTYISYSLYAPLATLFGMFAIKLAKFTKEELTKQSISDMDFQIISSVIIGQIIIIFCVFKIPTIINQIIGSQNEGGSLAGTISSLATAGRAVSGTTKTAAGGLHAGRVGIGKGISTAKAVGDKAAEVVDKLYKKFRAS
ncbi:MAG: type IV secretion system protein [Campylobacteraceae bacterium]|nr:type IV secretion system protein [Campylobacteraceae bacterium]